MGLMSKFAKVGIAKKVFDEARKPENQRRIKEAVASFQNKRKGGSKPPSGGSQPPSGPSTPQ